MANFEIPKHQIKKKERDMTFISDKLTQEMMAKHSNIEKLFEEFLFMTKSYDITSTTPWQPPTDVYETEKDIIIKMAVSGLKPEDISVVFSDYVLTVSGRRNENSEHRKICFYQVEVRYGYFERKIKIPKHVDANNTQAIYENGFIIIVIPKAEKAFTSTISIKITY